MSAGMSTATLISPSEYLGTSYRPNQELIDGQLLERKSGQWDHSNVQMAAAGYFYIRRREWKIRVLPEQRVQVS